MNCENCKCKDCMLVAIATCFSCDTCKNSNNSIKDCGKYEKFIPIIFSEQNRHLIMKGRNINENLCIHKR